MNTHNLKIHQVNINMEFLHAKLTKEIYISQPEGFVNKQRPHHVRQLLKSLYRLKQVLLEWNHAIDTHLRKSHFEPTNLERYLVLNMILSLMKWLILHHHAQPLARCCLRHAQVMYATCSNELQVKLG